MLCIDAPPIPHVCKTCWLVEKVGIGSTRCQRYRIAPVSLTLKTYFWRVGRESAESRSLPAKRLAAVVAQLCPGAISLVQG